MNRATPIEPAACGPLRQFMRRRADALRLAWLAAGGMAVAAVMSLPAVAQGTYQEVEPNNPCSSAQNLVGAPLPLQVRGYKSFDGQAVDYFRFYATPGTPLRVRLEPNNAAPAPLNSLVVGLFAATCPASPWVTGINISGPAMVSTTVPADGYFVVAVTACCDLSFTGSGTLQGGYLLSVEGTSAVVSSIRGKVTDMVTSAPLAGLTDPFAYVYLERLTPAGPELVAEGATLDDGSYSFVGVPVGSYRVAATASQYQVVDSAVDLGPVVANEDRLAPDLRLLPNPVRFINVRPCDDVPAEGGICRYSFEANLGADQMRSGVVWNIVNGSNSAGLIGGTQFQSCERPLTLIAGTPVANRTIRCQFFVPPTVPDDASFCVDAWFGDGSRVEPHMAVQGLRQLFCMSKRPGASRLQVLPQAPAAPRMQWMLRRR